MEHNYKKPKYTNMTIRQRLKISNVLMTVIPMLVTIICCLLVVGIALIWTHRTQELSAMSNEDIAQTCDMFMSRFCREISESDGPDFSDIENDLSQRNVRMLILKGEDTYFTYGTEKNIDASLLKAARQVGETEYISSINRQLFSASTTLNGDQYHFFFFIDKVDHPYHGIPVLTITVILVFITVAVLSFYFVNRFFFNFVFSRIMYPLEQLSDGVHEIRNGNLDYQISYNITDEFRPICDDFNEMSRRLRQSTEELKHQDENRKELLAGISHDLRSPLTSISAYTDGLLDGIAATPEARDKYLHQIKAKADEMIHLVSRLFMFSKMDMNEYPVYPVSLDLATEVSELIGAVRSEYADKGLIIETDRLEHGPITADPEQLHTVLVNILENSLKYRTENPGHLHISLTASADEFILTLADDGPGVDEEYLGRIFEVFYRTDPARRNSGSGSGLGLAIAAKAVHRAGGTITASNVQPHGLCIRITYPKGDSVCKKS